MKIIQESKMNFGPFDEKNLFHIEESQIYKELGDGIKTVEFIVKNGRDDIVFLEAKESCPNVSNRYESEEKEKKFEEYYISITDKFVESLQIFLSVLMDKHENISEVGMELSHIHSMRNIKMKFILVVRKAKDIAWLAGPLAELKARLRYIRKIWNIDIIVLNEELAKKNKLAC